MTSAETPAATCPKGSASGWKKRTVTILAVVLFWTMFALAFILATKKPGQGLQISNTGSKSVDIRNASAPWWDDKVLTLHPGMTGLWNFRDFDQFRITLSDEGPPKSGTTPPSDPLLSRSEAWGTPLTQNADGSGTIVLRHADRTAEVRVNKAGKIEFEFTDL